MFACVHFEKRKEKTCLSVCVCACVCMLVCVYQRVCSSLYRSTLLLKKIVKKQSELRLMRSVFQELKGQSAALSGFFFFVVVVVVKFPSVTLNWHLF